MRGFLICCSLGASHIAGAAVLTMVPMQGGMVMPMFTYRASSGELSVTVEPTVPALTPLLASHPGDSFDPADPWFDSLDPGRRGLAFSRRYGFVMDTGSDPLPAGAEIWIRKVSSSPGLEAYRYRTSGAKLWEPIFGTAGSTNALRWDGTMFHPAFAAQVTTNTHTAAFEAYLLDRETGAMLPGGGPVPFSFNWTVVPDGRPALDIGSMYVVRWPVAATQYVLEQCHDLYSGDWATVTNKPVELDGRMAVVLEPGQASHYFRMRQVQ